MYSEIARKNKHFRKRKHILNDDDYAYADEDDEITENLMKKTEITEVTAERFASWLASFRAEMKVKQDRDPVFQRKKMMLAKPSGRMIFNDRTKDFTAYYDDEKNEDDDEAVDVKREMVDQEGVDIDEDVFDDEDLDLDDLDDEQAEDEDNDVVYS